MNKIFFLFIFSLLPGICLASPLDGTASWTESNGKTTTLSQWKGKKIVFAMLYPRCTTACPLVLGKLKKIQARLDEKKEKAEFILISFDSEDESAARLTEYREHMGITKENWHFLFGKSQDVRTLSNLVNIRYWRNPKTKDISHDNVILLLGEKGEIVRRLEGLDAALDTLF